MLSVFNDIRPTGNYNSLYNIYQNFLEDIEGRKEKGERRKEKGERRLILEP